MPEECREEIRERLKERALTIRVLCGQGMYADAQEYHHKLKELAWVLGEDEA